MYPDPRVEGFIRENFLPVKIHIKEQPATFQRFGAQWTPTIAILDPDGSERHRFEGFLPADDFLRNSSWDSRMRHLLANSGQKPSSDTVRLWIICPTPMPHRKRCTGLAYQNTKRVETRSR